MRDISLLHTAKRVGLFGGTFNPPHLGHLAMANLARQELNLDYVVFIPSGNPPHKTNAVASEIRLRLVELAVEDNPYFIIWDGEINNREPSYTINTVNWFKENFDSVFYFIIGSDNLAEIETWYKYTELLTNVNFAVAYRPSYKLEIPAPLTKGHFVEFLSPNWGISSTLIREYIKKGIDCKYLLPEPVNEFIKYNKIY